MKKKMTFILLIVFAILFASSTYALFRSGFGGLGSMSAATWSVTLNQPSGGSDHLSIMPSPNEMVASYTVNITSVSEVNVIYSIEIDNIPTGVSVSLDGGTYEPENNHKIVFSNFNPISYNDNNKNRSHILTFKATSGVTYVSNSEVDIDVIARQQI